MVETLPITLSINYAKNELVMTVKGKYGHVSKAHTDLDGIAEFMAILSHCQHVLVHSLRGHRLLLPLDLATALKPVAGQFALTAREEIEKLAVGDDTTSGEVVMALLTTAGRISGFRMSPEMARRLGSGLLRSAEQTGNQPTKQ